MPLQPLWWYRRPYTVVSIWILHCLFQKAQMFWVNMSVRDDEKGRVPKKYISLGLRNIWILFNVRQYHTGVWYFIHAVLSTETVLEVFWQYLKWKWHLDTDEYFFLKSASLILLANRQMSCFQKVELLILIFYLG